jgi:geranylgeranyl pyrophosphate synthase
MAGANEADIEAAAEYGRSLGTAFQLIDDVLDYAGDAAKSARTSATTCAKANRRCR